MKTFVRFASASLLALVVGLAASPASAQFGVRAGYSFEPNQVVLGGHYMIPIGTSGLHFIPSAEVGFGDELFTLQANGDLTYRFESSGSVKPYLGGGITVANYDPDDVDVPDGGEDINVDSETEVGFNAIGGAWFNATGSTPWFLEGKVGLVDEVPDFKVMVGVGL